MIVCHQSKCSEYIFQIKFSVLIQWTPCDAFLSYLSFFQSNDLMDLKCPWKGSNIVPKLAQSPDFHHRNFSPPPKSRHENSEQTAYPISDLFFFPKFHSKCNCIPWEVTFFVTNIYLGCPWYHCLPPCQLYLSSYRVFSNCSVLPFIGLGRFQVAGVERLTLILVDGTTISCCHLTVHWPALNLPAKLWQSVNIKQWWSGK